MYETTRNNNIIHKLTIMTWKTQVKYFDAATGEQIPKRQVDLGHFLVIKSITKNVKQNEHFGIKHIDKVCERNKQIKLF